MQIWVWNRQAFMQWAASRHFPQVFLNKTERVYAGEKSWQHFLREATDEALDHLHRRILCWNAWEGEGSRIEGNN